MKTNSVRIKVLSCVTYQKDVEAVEGPVRVSWIHHVIQEH